MVKQFKYLRDGFTLIFTGPPGCGKGTYGRILAERWGIHHVSVGDLIRAETTNASLGAASKSLADRGLLIPDHLASHICKKYIRSNASWKSWILDGFPRTLRQAEMLREFAKPHACINFHLPEGILLKKLLGRRVCRICGGNFNTTEIHDPPYDMPAILPQEDCIECNGAAPLLRRVDDTAETIQQRLETYEKYTRPVLDQYDAEGILLNFEVVKGLGDIGRLESAIISFLQSRYDERTAYIGSR